MFDTDDWTDFSPFDCDEVEDDDWNDFSPFDCDEVEDLDEE